MKGLGRGAWGFQSREPVGERGCRAQISEMWDTGVVKMGSSGLEEVMGSLVCT